MFLLIPFVIFLASILAIAYITARKFSYLKKLNPEQNVESGTEGTGTFIQLMFPEIFNYFRGEKISSHKSSLLLEFEKFLRKARLAFLKIDNISNNLIHKIRSSHQNELAKIEEKQAEAEKSQTIAESIVTDPITELKKREHELIIEIAKDPKNIELYKALGDIYIELKQFADARDSFMSAIKLNPQVKGVKRKLAFANKILGPQQSDI